MTVPSVVARLLLGDEISGASIPLGRVAGFGLLSLGMACWPGRDPAGNTAPALRAMRTYNLLATLYLLCLGVGGESVGPLLWPAVALHGIPVAPACFAFVTRAELRSVLKHMEVTGETISLAVSVYLLLGLTWGMLYIVIFQVQPDAFSFGTSPTSLAVAAPNEPHLFAVFLYFSLTTLATIAYGDITPVSLQARYAAVAEGITGQLYLAILIARLVGMHMSRSTSQDVGNQARTP